MLFFTSVRILGVFQLLIIKNPLIMNRLVCFICFLFIVFSCSFQEKKSVNKKLAIKDSILVSNIRRYRKETTDIDLLTLKFNRLESEEFGFSLYNTFSGTRLSGFHYYAYFDGKPIILKDTCSRKMITCLDYKKIDSVFINKVSYLLSDNITGESLYWVISYRDKKVYINKTYFPFPGTH